MSDFFYQAASALLQNFALLIVLAFAFSLSSAYLARLSTYKRQGSYGVLFGVMAILCMSFPITVMPGVIADMRNVVILMAAPFGGPLAGVIAGLLGSVYRLFLGGTGAEIGAAGIAIAAGLGIGFSLRFGRLRSYRATFILGALMTVVTYPVYTLLPAPADGPSFLRHVIPVMSVLNPFGAVILFAILNLEVKRRRAEAALKHSETRFRDIVETASDWFWEMDAELRFTYLSSRFTAITGLQPSVMLGKRRDELWHGQVTREFKQHLEDLEARRPFTDFRYPIRTPSGDLHYLTASGKPVFDDRGRFKGYRGSGGDITGEVEAMRQLDNARRRAEESSRIKSTFLANMSHELRTPLNAVIGFSEIMRDELLGPIGNDSYKQYASDINSSGRFLLELINDILDLSKVEAGRYEIYPERQAVSSLVQNAWMLVSERARQRGVQVRNEVAEDLPLLHVDPRLMRQVMINLIGNAVKFTDKGGEVAITARLLNDGGLEVVIADSGIGIAPEDLDEIMEPFRQARHGAQTRDGTGLGLSLSKAFVELHGGKLLVESCVGVGTTVRVQLPKEHVLPQSADGSAAAIPIKKAGSQA